MSYFSLTDKVAVITGGGSGIGLATARRFSAAGAKVTIANRSDSRALAKSFGAAYIQTDVAEEEQVRALMDAVAREHGRIDVVVNNAGYGAVGTDTLGLDRESFDKHLHINLHGVLYGIKHGAKHMPKGGSIVNVASLASLIGIPGYAAYVAAKSAVVGLSKSAAIELAPRGIRVNCVCPGTIDTPINQAAGADAELELVKSLAPLGRIGQPEEIAAAIHFFASDDSSYITGTELVADGGWRTGVSIGVIEKLMQSN